MLLGFNSKKQFDLRRYAVCVRRHMEGLEFLEFMMEQKQTIPTRQTITYQYLRIFSFFLKMEGMLFLFSLQCIC